MQSTIWREHLYLRRRNLVLRDWPVVAEALSLLADGHGGVILTIGDMQREAERLGWELERYTKAACVASDEGWLGSIDWDRTGAMRTALTIPEGTS